jgi:hypothetical protein
VAVFLAFNRLGIEVVLVRGGTASVESAASIVLYFARSRDGESRGRGGTDITLKLSGGRSENAASSAGIGDFSVVDAVGGRSVASTNAVLAVTELADGARFSARSGQLEAATISPRKD